MAARLKGWLIARYASADYVFQQRVCMLALVDVIAFGAAFSAVLLSAIYLGRPISSPEVRRGLAISLATAVSLALAMHGRYGPAAHITVLVTFVTVWALVLDKSRLYAPQSEAAYAVAVLALPALLLGRWWTLLYGAVTLVLVGITTARLTALVPGFPRKEVAGLGLDVSVSAMFIVVIALMISRMYELAIEQVSSLLAVEQRIEAQKRQFYRDTIYSVTKGKLCICDDETITRLIAEADMAVEVHDPAMLSPVRRQIGEFCAGAGVRDPELGILLIAIGEAITNAIRHASGGWVFAGTKDGTVWIAITDDGPGIESLILPRAILLPGFSTLPSLGMGYTIMLDAADRILLNTSAAGTQVVLLGQLSPHTLGATLPDWSDIRTA